MNWFSRPPRPFTGGDEIVADFTELIDLADEDDKVSRTLLTSDVFILLDGPAIFGDDPREMEKVGAVFEKLIKKHKHVFVQLGHDIGANDMRDLLREAGHKFKILNLDDHPYLYRYILDTYGDASGVLFIDGKPQNMAELWRTPS
ncbi:uncharacterized protein BJ171DRAFT_574857 [Polychytrium aggregatum]|uniref:uncharacterized protein n=1 Tax=Polychytrium aggregatum TaxID=110093 RepID=UPI0022FE0927|nr:uncharacterized protein BJ171DRAFT_574857 [Polychytrium aggregatum]KAI9190631.1 hypothetical protein BJ171DRAFT_574857 [Polychytrium aggregatum]